MEGVVLAQEVFIGFFGSSETCSISFDPVVVMINTFPHGDLNSRRRECGML